MPCEKGSRNRVCPQIALALALFALRATKKEPCGSLRSLAAEGMSRCHTCNTINIYIERGRGRGVFTCVSIRMSLYMFLREKRYTVTLRDFPCGARGFDRDASVTISPQSRNGTLIETVQGHERRPAGAHGGEAYGPPRLGSWHPFQGRLVGVTAPRGVLQQ